MSSAGTALEVRSAAQSMGPDVEESSSNNMVEDGSVSSDTEIVQGEPTNPDCDKEADMKDDEESEVAAGLNNSNNSVVISDSENEVPPTNINSKSEEEEEEDVITITANDGSLGRGHVIAPKPPMPEDDDDEVELLEDDDSNSIEHIPNGQEEDDLLADEESSMDNRIYNELDSSLSNDVSSRTKDKCNEDDDDVMLISDEEDSLASSTTKNSAGSSRSAGFSANQASLLAKSGVTIESVRVKDGFSKALKGQNRIIDEDIMEIEDSDPLGGVDGEDSENDSSQEDNIQNDSEALVNGDCNETEEKVEDNDASTIVVNDTKSLVELANSKNEPGKEPTLVIIDTNSILSGKGPVPMSNKAPNSSTGGTRSPASRGSSIDIPDDAYLIEAPSFIVPYVFEQSGEKSLKECITGIASKVKAEREAKLAKGEELTAADEIQEPKKVNSEEYFDSPVGKLLMNIGMNLVQEYVQCDLLKMQKRQGEKEKVKSRMGMMTHMTQQSIISLKKNIEESKENNEPFRSKTKKCELCNFKSESELVMSTHLETPHMRNYSYRCNFCTYTTRVPQEIIFHMEAEHNIQARLERAPAYHQCPNCPFEDNSKAKLNRHLLGCTKRFSIDKNLEPPLDWDTPAKLPKLPKNRMLPQGINPAFLAPNQQRGLGAFLGLAPKQMQGPKGSLPPLIQAPKNKPIPGLIRTSNNNPRGMQAPIMSPHLPRGLMMRGVGGLQGQMQQGHLQLTNNQMLQQVVSGQLLGIGQGAASGFLTKLGLQQPSQSTGSSSVQKSASPQPMRGGAKTSNQPSISITPLPRQSARPSTSAASQQKPEGKTSFVICEICDGYIKDLDQLRNHMQWIHKVKIHPKMIYNKPPLNCQKCQFRFFTDQGLERHLLGSHGLVTSSMQDAANKGQDSGRCPLCGKVYQWKLLAHVAKDHNVTLKPAHLSYKCTVCTATFGMYKLFESHVYSAHSVTKNAPRPERRQIGSQPQQAPNRMSQLQVTPRTMPTSTSQANSFKPLKINDEITIIPQPLANASPAHRNRGSLTITPQPGPPRRNMRNNDDDGIQIIEIDDAPHKVSSNGRNQNGDFKNRFPMSETLRKRNLEISLCGTDSDNSDDARGPPKRLRQN